MSTFDTNNVERDQYYRVTVEVLVHGDSGWDFVTEEALETEDEAREFAEEYLFEDSDEIYRTTIDLVASVVTSTTVEILENVYEDVDLDLDDETKSDNLDDDELTHQVEQELAVIECVDEQCCGEMACRSIEWEVFAEEADVLIDYVQGKISLRELSFADPDAQAEGEKVKRQKLSRARVRKNATRWFEVG